MRAVSQKDVLAAAIGNPEYYRECTSIYPCGSPLETNAGTKFAFPTDLNEAKKLLTAARRDRLAAHAEEMVALSARLFSSPEAQEGIHAFLERRPPAWQV